MSCLDYLDGCAWTFVRIHDSSWEEHFRIFRATYWSAPWTIDRPAVEQNLSRGLGCVTSIEVNDPVALTLDDERLWQYPWIYFVEPGNIRFKPTEADIFREFPSRGGMATFDDFYAPTEWDILQCEIKRVFFDRDIVRLPPDYSEIGPHCRGIFPLP